MKKQAEVGGDESHAREGDVAEGKLVIPQPAVHRSSASTLSISQEPVTPTTREEKSFSQCSAEGNERDAFVDALENFSFRDSEDYEVSCTGLDSIVPDSIQGYSNEELLALYDQDFKAGLASLENSIKVNQLRRLLGVWVGRLGRLPC